MRRSVRLALGGAWLLLLGACADRPPASAPYGAGSSRGEAQPGRPRSSHEGHADPPDFEAARFEPAAGKLDSARGDQLAERYARARPLAVQHGSASYYSDAFAGRRTASGATYEPRGMTAAHRSLPFGTVLRVVRSDGGRSVYVRVTDRGPFGPKGRILDLSRAAAEELGMLRAGVVKVKLEVVEYGQPRKPRRRRR
jgi:rare lipoprotein A